MVSTQDRLNKMERELADLQKKQEEIYQLLIQGNLEGSLVDDLHYIIQINKRQQQYMTKMQNNLQNAQVDYTELMNFNKDIGVWEQFQKQKEDKLKAQQQAMEELQRKQMEAQKKAQEGKSDGKENQEEEKSGSTDQQD